MKTRLVLCALLLALCALPFAIAAQKPDKIHVVFFQDAAGVQHPYWLDKPVSSSDGMAVREALFGIARAEQAKGDDSFLRAITEGVYTDSGSLCYVTARSGGRVYYCGQCGGGGCAQVKAIR